MYIGFVIGMVYLDISAVLMVFRLDFKVLILFDFTVL